MRQISQAQADELRSLLHEAEQATRDLAVENSYRADAMRLVRERLLHLAHTERARRLLHLAAQLQAASARLAQARPVPPRQPRRRPAVSRESHPVG